ncbi:PREDICTED: nurim-like [Priapulus caudatus]|uniref:Nuclear envelope membrane protein n=1 Tax=Priapulus caudatus TaxID=37621 RepID=A0ABM1EXR8_PRICU|nr:PREDICTED: nurim-like [Priapulus caudatus]
MKIFYALVAGAVLFSSIGTLLNFQRFLSGHIDVSKQAHQALARKETNYFVTKTVFWDLGLLIMFILQHSLMANHRWKNLVNNTLGLSVVERSIYVGASCLALQALMHQWVPVFSGTAWLVDVSSRQGNQLYSLLFFAVHVVAWVLTLGSLLLMDILELGGVKQVYFYCIGLNPPITYKHHSLARIYAHNRHPCALEL